MSLLFISHSSVDHAAALEVQGRLQAQGYEGSSLTSTDQRCPCRAVVGKGVVLAAASLRCRHPPRQPRVGAVRMVLRGGLPGSVAGPAGVSAQP